MHLTLIVLILFNMLDAIFTIVALKLGIAKESNPIMEFYTSNSYILFFLVKMLLVLLGCSILLKFKEKKFSQLAAFLLCGVYVWVFCKYHTTTIKYVLTGEF